MARRRPKETAKLYRVEIKKPDKDKYSTAAEVAIYGSKAGAQTKVNAALRMGWEVISVRETPANWVSSHDVTVSDDWAFKRLSEE